MDSGFRFIFLPLFENFSQLLKKDWRWSSDPTHGLVPPGRRGHTAVFVKECKAIIIYGGSFLLKVCNDKIKNFEGVYGYNKILDDCYSLDLEKRTWTAIEYSANDDFIPKGRAWHSAIKIKDDIFYIGGMLKNQDFTNEVLPLILS